MNKPTRLSIDEAKEALSTTRVISWYYSKLAHGERGYKHTFVTEYTSNYPYGFCVITETMNWQKEITGLD